MTIGFGNGDFWQLYANDLERFEDGVLQRFIDAGARAIELHCCNIDAVDHLLTHVCNAIHKFDFVSLHAPDLIYDDNRVTHDALTKIAQASKKFSIDNIVLHTDKVKNWNVIAAYKHMMPISIENMDDRKMWGRTVADVASILDIYDFGLTLDLQHCYVNDQSMHIAYDLQKMYKDRIVEYHISGYHPEKLHVPLCETRQDVIIESLFYPVVPIIIESVFNAYADAEKELWYIKNKLKNKT